MPSCSRRIKLGRCGSMRLGDVSRRPGLSSTSKCSSSKRTGISQNSLVAGDDSLMTALTRSGRAEALSIARAARGRQPAGEPHSLEAGAEPLVEGLALPALAQLGGEGGQFLPELVFRNGQAGLEKHNKSALARRAELAGLARRHRLHHVLEIEQAHAFTEAIGGSRVERKGRH